ncbi:MAG: hypothetical protein QNJ81_06085 [Acidimicrobiia bacterium]|nr:hypothetical protein [Acidimicrobiia bacterium]
MHDFYGSVFLLDDPDSVLDAKVTVDLNRVIIQADNTEIGAWRHADVRVKKVKGKVHLIADDETLVLELEGQEFFLDLLGANDDGPPKSRRRRKAESQYGKGPSSAFSLANVKELARENAAEQIDRRLAIAMAVAALAILGGAALTWGPFRLMDPGSFPIARLLAGFGGLGGLLALYLAYFDRNRAMGSAAAISAGFVTFCIVYLYARSARLGIGFILVLLGAQALMTAGILGLVRRRTEPEDD